MRILPRNLRKRTRMMRKVGHDVSGADADGVGPQKPSAKLSRQPAKVKSSSWTTQSSTQMTATRRMMSGQVDQAAIQMLRNGTMTRNARADASGVVDGDAAEPLVTQPLLRRPATAATVMTLLQRAMRITRKSVHGEDEADADVVERNPNATSVWSPSPM
jgi:hypothetical protein